MDTLGNCASSNGANPAGQRRRVAVSSANLTGQGRYWLTDPSTVTISSAPSHPGRIGIQHRSRGPVQTNHQQQCRNSIFLYPPMEYRSSVRHRHRQQDLQGSGHKSRRMVYQRSHQCKRLLLPRLRLNLGRNGAGRPFSWPSISAQSPSAQSDRRQRRGVRRRQLQQSPPPVSMYIGLRRSDQRQLFYAQYVPSPVSAQAYTIHAPSDTYNFFAILDQNNDGLIDTRDLQDATDNGNGNSNGVTVPLSPARPRVSTSPFPAPAPPPLSPPRTSGPQTVPLSARTTTCTSRSPVLSSSRSRPLSYLRPHFWSLAPSMLPSAASEAATAVMASRSTSNTGTTLSPLSAIPTPSTSPTATPQPEP